MGCEQKWHPSETSLSFFRDDPHKCSRCVDPPTQTSEWRLGCLGSRFWKGYIITHMKFRGGALRAHTHGWRKESKVGQMENLDSAKSSEAGVFFQTCPTLGQWSELSYPMSVTHWMQVTPRKGMWSWRRWSSSAESHSWSGMTAARGRQCSQQLESSSDALEQASISPREPIIKCSGIWWAGY